MTDDDHRDDETHRAASDRDDEAWDDGEWNDDEAWDDGPAGDGEGGRSDDGDEEPAPLSDLRRDVAERREDREADDDFFDEMDVGDVDEDAVWDELASSADETVAATGPAEPVERDEDRGAGSATDAGGAGSATDAGGGGSRPGGAGRGSDAGVDRESDVAAGGGDGTDVGAGGDVTVVEKRLCHRCPHFADPPDTACTHDGTVIAAEVDVDHFRVVDCPVVAQRRDVEASDFSADDG